MAVHTHQSAFSLSRELQRFREARSGGVAVTFAVALIVLCMVVGGAVDFGSAFAAKKKLQTAIDGTALLAATSSDTGRADRALRYFRENFHIQGVTGADPQIQIAPDGRVTVAASLSMETAFLKIAHLDTLPVVATATAKTNLEKVAKVNFTAISAKGWFAKDIFAYVRDANGNIVQIVKVLSYDYSHPSGVQTFVPPVNQASETFTLQGGETFGVLMRVWPDSVNIGSRQGSFIDYYSDDPAPRIQMTGDCATGQRHDWEDGGDSDYADFVYSMTCESMVGKVRGARLVE